MEKNKNLKEVEIKISGKEWEEALKEAYKCKNKNTNEYCYLLDQLMGIEKHARITEDALARVLEESSESSYRKGGTNVSISGDSISKEAVMNKLHCLQFPVPEVKEKKELKTIYIDADEDHVSLQYQRLHKHR